MQKEINYLKQTIKLLERIEQITKKRVGQYGYIPDNNEYYYWGGIPQNITKEF